MKAVVINKVLELAIIRQRARETETAELLS